MLAPLPPDYWSAEVAAHLALRAGFGQTPDESKKWSQQGMEAMLDHLLQTPTDNVAPPEWAYPTRDEDLLQRIRNPATIPEEKAQVQRDLSIRKSDHTNWRENSFTEFCPNRSRYPKRHRPLQHRQWQWEFVPSDFPRYLQQSV